MKIDYWYNAKGGNYLSKYIKKMTRIEKLKYILVQEYKEGNFYSIPDELLERKSELTELFDELKRLYEESEKSVVCIPEGLYDGNTETERLISVLKEKKQKGIQIDTLIIPNGNYTESDKAFLKELVKSDPSKKESMKEKAYRIFHEVQEFLDDPNNGEMIIGNPFLMTIEENASDLDLAEFEPKEFTVSECNELQRVMRNANKGEQSYVFSEYLTQKIKSKYTDKFEELELGYDFLMSSSVERFLRYEQFSKRDDLISKGDLSRDTIATLNKQKKFLQDMFEILSNAGFLENYLIRENGKRDMFNQMFGTEEEIENEKFWINNGTFPHISPKSIIKEIKKLDMSKKEDAIKMYLYTISYANQLVEGYSAYAVTSMMLKTVGDGGFVVKLFDARLEKKRKMEAGEYDSQEEFAKKSRLLRHNNLEYYCSDLVSTLYNAMLCYQVMTRTDNANNLKYVPFSRYLEDVLKSRYVAHTKMPKFTYDKEPELAEKFMYVINNFIHSVEYEDILVDMDKVLPAITKKLEFASFFNSVAKNASLSLLNAYKENPGLLTLRLDKGSTVNNGNIIAFLPGEYSFHKIPYKDETFGEQASRFFVLPSIENSTSKYISSGIENIITEDLPHGFKEPKDKTLLKRMNDTFEYIEDVPLSERTRDKMNGHYKYWDVSTPNRSEHFVKSLRIMAALSQGTEYFRERLLKSEYKEPELTDDEASVSRLLVTMLCNKNIPDESVLNGKLGFNNPKVLSFALDTIRKLYEESERTGVPIYDMPVQIRNINRQAVISGMNGEGSAFARNVQRANENKDKNI